MKTIILGLLVSISTPAFAIGEDLQCFDVHSPNSYNVRFNVQNHTVEFTDMVSKEVITATRDIFSTDALVPLFLSTEQLDQDGREMMAEACQLNPEPKAPIVNVMLWSGKTDGTTAIADRCFTCFK